MLEAVTVDTLEQRFCSACADAVGPHEPDIAANLEAHLALALQLRFSLQVCALCGGLVGATPGGPGEDEGGLDAALREARGDPAD
ncbi:MAG TPA: hypothetical protein VE684_17285, partial [Crenalkalicoccus sp.]|nr:hypothetical protein [Crenalkalicoccus sp.]